MFEKLTYINSMNESLSFGEAGLYINKNDLHDYAWDISKKNNRISGFKKKITKKTLPVVIAGFSSETDAVKAKNSLFEIMEKDVLANTPGKLILGDYYMKCFVTGMKMQKYNRYKDFMSATITVQTDTPYWVKETTSTFGYGEKPAGQNMDYNNDFDMDYTSNLTGELVNSDFVSSNAILRIYGPATSPKLTIAGHDYSVGVNLLANEYLEINTEEKTIYKTKQNGERVNCFANRDKSSYIFEKVPAGKSSVSNNDGDFLFDITILEERSQPKWI